MANKGCNNCEHYNLGKINMWRDDDPHSCKLDNKEEFNNWWIENGHKTDKNNISDMPCYQETKLGKLSNKLHEILDEMIKVADKK